MHFLIASALALPRSPDSPPSLVCALAQSFSAIASDHALRGIVLAWWLGLYPEAFSVTASFVHLIGVSPRDLIRASLGNTEVQPHRNHKPRVSGGVVRMRNLEGDHVRESVGVLLQRACPTLRVLAAHFRGRETPLYPLSVSVSVCVCLTFSLDFSGKCLDNVGLWIT